MVTTTTNIPNRIDTKMMKGKEMKKVPKPGRKPVVPKEIQEARRTINGGIEKGDDLIVRMKKMESKGNVKKMKCGGKVSKMKCGGKVKKK